MACWSRPYRLASHPNASCESRSPCAGTAKALAVLRLERVSRSDAPRRVGAVPRAVFGIRVGELFLDDLHDRLHQHRVEPDVRVEALATLRPTFLSPASTGRSSSMNTVPVLRFFAMSSTAGWKPWPIATTRSASCRASTCRVVTSRSCGSAPAGRQVLHRHARATDLPRRFGERVERRRRRPRDRCRHSTSTAGARPDEQRGDQGGDQGADHTTDLEPFLIMRIILIDSGTGSKPYPHPHGGCSHPCRDGHDARGPRDVARRVGLGATWPYADAATLSDRVVGADAVPAPRCCFAVAGLLGIAAAARLRDTAAVAGRQRHRSSRPGDCARGAGCARHRRAHRPRRAGSSSPAFRRRDRYAYAPLCFVLAAARYRVDRSRVESASH